MNESNEHLKISHLVIKSSHAEILDGQEKNWIFSHSVFSYLPNLFFLSKSILDADEEPIKNYYDSFYDDLL